MFFILSAFLVFTPTDKNYFKMENVKGKISLKQKKRIL